jgi:RNA polymerase sigma-70 factor, ECF subfamily
VAEPPSDGDLLHRARGGDAGAFALVYGRHRDVVFRFAARLSGSTETAEDVTHDCFLALVAGPNGFDPARATLRTYLCAAARNQVFKRFRADARTAGTVDDDAPDAPLNLPVQIDRAAAVQAAVAALPPLQREVVALVEYEGCTLAEAAAVAAVDVGTVKSRLHRARAALRRALAAHGGSHD